MRDVVEKSRERFVREVAEHEMTILHDDGLYRHLLFKAPQNSFYWFELLTAPGVLHFSGDGESWTFRRVRDMFEFFRGQRVNPSYWSQKLTSNRDAAQRYSPDLFRARVTEDFVERVRWGGVPPGTGRALRREVLDWADLEHEAREALDRFEFHGFRIHDAWEMSFHDYDWWFLWSLHAIVWGIERYDVHHGAAPRELFRPSVRAPARAPEPSSRFITATTTGDQL